MKDFSSNDFTKQSLAQAIEEMKSIQGKDFSIENINLTEQVIEYDSKMYSQKLKTRFWFGSTCGLGLAVIALILL